MEPPGWVAPGPETIPPKTRSPGRVPDVRGSTVFIAAIATLSASVAQAADPIPSRLGTNKVPYLHTHERAGTASSARVTIPGMTRYDGLGYVNGATFGTDFTGFGWRPGRVFPGLWSDRTKSFSNKYATDNHVHVPDVVALQPFRKAVRETRAEKAHGPESR